MADNDATIFGLPKQSITWNADFKATKDNNNKWSGSESFTLNADDVVQFIPAIDAPATHPGFTFMRVSSVDVINNEGNTYVITCHYGGVTTSDDLSDDSDAIGESDGYTDTLSSLSSEEVTNTLTFAENKVTTGMSCSVSEEPIGKFWKFKNIPDSELSIIKNVQSGAYRTVDFPNYKFINSSDNDKIGKTYQITSEAGRKLMRYIWQGVETIRVPRQIVHKKYTSANLPDVGKVGSVGQPPACYGGGERDWMFVGATAEKTNRVYDITLEWEKSAPGGWDSFLYK